MKHLRTIGLALVAVFAMSAIASATASAAAHPLIVNSKGQLPGKAGFTGTSGASTLEVLQAISCKADSVRGKITGPSTDEEEIKFTGCTAAAGLDKCKTGATAGEIVLSVNSELVWLDKAESEKPGEDLVLPGNLTIECTGFAKETLIVMGSVLCPITPFKKLSKTAELTCNQSKGAQEFTKYFLGGIEITDILEAEGKGIKNFALEQAGLTTTDTLTFEEEVEIH